MSEIGWAEHELEHLNRCPVCGASERDLCYPRMEDKICGTRGKWDYYRCRSCSVLYIDPRPSEETIGRAYQDYFTHSVLEERERVGWLDKVAFGMRNDYLNWKFGYNKHPVLPGGRWLMYLLPPWLRLEWDNCARHLPKPEEGRNRLLDVGCGNGDFLALAQSAGWECHGVDFDEKAVGIARSRGLQVCLADKLSAYPESSFDAITVSHVIEHVHHPETLLKRCVRVLRTGGVLWIASPNSNSIVSKYFNRHWVGLAAPQHLVLFDSESLRKLVERLGFQVRLRRRGVHIQSHWEASRALEQGKIGITDICICPFVNRKIRLRHWLTECLCYFAPSTQGDIVLSAIRICVSRNCFFSGT